MITNLHTQLTEILGGIIFRCCILDNSFKFSVRYTETHPLHIYKSESFKELLSNLFDVNECDILITNFTDTPTRWTVIGMRIPGVIHVTFNVGNIPKYIIDQIIKSDTKKLISIGYFTTTEKDI
jgi:hypothetical protein